VPLKADEVIRTINRHNFEEIRARHGMEDPGEEPPKYLDLPVWIEANLKRIRDLELDMGRRRRVLDIGSGTGYFLYICQLLGHDAIGIDLDEMPMFNEMIDLLDIDRYVWRVQPFVPLPALGAKFDVITGHQICFNGHKSDQLWGVAEWNFFLDDLGRHLKPGGRIWLEFNREFDGTCYSPELEQLFKRRGAEVISNRVIFNSLRPAPVEAAPA
jgi:SAM-dependent methyltransferase